MQLGADFIRFMPTVWAVRFSGCPFLFGYIRDSFRINLNLFERLKRHCTVLLKNNSILQKQKERQDDYGIQAVGRL